ncbi:hypothetical protein FSP39_018748 [Pinctada imbricata]|uniref:Uncharacterized protein n=1 Tax=Pinctada imbricata TaxID=66713 RepID=A0AA89CCU7_PINIB|nr:hypothetical protein FSP39_018748 [Pinctada imbricata]
MDHFLFNTENKKVIGKMKDECQGQIMKEFIGLKPKMYSFTYEKNIDETIHCEEKKRAKGVSKDVVKYNIHHDNYRDCLLNEEYEMESMVSFRSYNHHIYTIKLNKTSLNPYDDKRYILRDGVNTLAHGHWRILDD